MLLLVVEAELDQRQRGSAKPRQRRRNGLVDMGATGEDLVQARAAEHAAARARVALALALVIGIEQIGPALVAQAIAGDMVAQDEGLEEPAGVGEVPFGRRGVGHRLEGGVGVGQRRGDGRAQRAHRAVALGQRRGGRESAWVAIGGSLHENSQGLALVTQRRLGLAG